MESLDQLLKTVSRSFYLSLRILPSSVRAPMGIAYLLCRAADTVADTTVIPAERRLELIREFRSVFETFPLQAEKASALAETLKESLDGDLSHERTLIVRLGECVQDFLALSNTDRVLIQRVVVGVTTGMEADLRRFGTDPETLQSLQTDQELEDYIGWIGGEPGHFWNDLCAAHGVKYASGEMSMRELAFRFGTGLQMVNILRDLPADLKAGRCYLPADRLREAGLTPDILREKPDEEAFRTLYHRVIDETVIRLECGLQYVERLPESSISLRAAAWWPLALALRTLAMLRSTSSVLGGGPAVKVKRREVYWLMATSLPELPFNGLLRRDFEDLAEPAGSPAGFQ